MINAIEFQRVFLALEPRAVATDPNDRAYHHLLRGLVYLIREVMVDEGSTTSQKIVFARVVTDAMHLLDPVAAAEQMEALAADPMNAPVMVAYSCAADVFTDCQAAKDSVLAQLHAPIPA